MESLLLKIKEQPSSPVKAPSDRGLDLLKILSHDLRGSLVSMSALLHILNRGCRENDALLETKLSELIDKMGGLSSMLEESLQMLLTLERGEGEETTLLDIKRDVLVPVISEFAPEIRNRHLEVDKPSGTVTGFFVPVKTNRTVLKMIFRNLFGNAVKYSEIGGTIVVSVKYGSPFCLVKVYNSGRPITEGQRKLLFSKPSPPTLQRERNLDGMGLGLHLAKRIMQTQGGEIWHEPEEQGATFVLAVPVETRHHMYGTYVQGTLFS